jgi:hypothetical protein
MKTLKRLFTLSALTLAMTAGAQSVFADSHSCNGDCKDKKECHCKDCKCGNEKECTCDKECKAASCKDHHKGHDDKK